MGLVVGLLDLSSPLCLIDRAAHGIRDRIRVHDDMSLRVSRGASDGLDEGRLASQEPLLVRVQDRHQGDLGNIKSFS